MFEMICRRFDYVYIMTKWSETEIHNEKKSPNTVSRAVDWMEMELAQLLLHTQTDDA